MDNMVSDVAVQDLGPPFDHNLVSCRIHIDVEAQILTRHSFRDFKNTDLPKLRHLFLSSSLFTSPAESADDYAAQFEKVSTEILDELAPVKITSKKSRTKPRIWLSDEALAAKRKRRRLERAWKSNRCEESISV